MTDKIAAVSSFTPAKEVKIGFEKNAVKTEQRQAKSTESDKSAATENAKPEGEAVIFDKTNPYEGLSTYNKKGNRIDPSTIETMKSEAEAKYAQMIETLKKMVINQGAEHGASLDSFKILKDYKKDVADLKIKSSESLGGFDEYWSAEATSDRIVDFAKQLSGGDTSKYETLKNAIKKGFDAASSYFKKMPDITGQTYDLVMKKLDDWAGKIEKPAEAE